MASGDSKEAPTTVAAKSADAELELVRRLRDNDPTAYETLVRDYGGRMLAVARRMLSSDEDAQDAIQEAFLSAFRALAGFDGRSQLGTWLHRIVINACLMRLRTKRRRPETSIEALLPQFLDDGHQAQPATIWRHTAEELAQNVELRALVRESIERLPESYRTVLKLRDLEELDTRETAEILGIQENAVKVRLHRARLALRTLLDERLKNE